VAEGNAESPRTGGRRKCREARNWWQKEMQRGQEMVAKGNAEKRRTGSKRKWRETKNWWQKEMQRPRNGSKRKCREA
jgi:hypothetical protein